jgi:hypothetical protein
MSFIPHSNGAGALFELVARGNKDKFLTRNDSEAQNAFNNFYKSSAPFTTERRTIVPLNEPQFGNTFEVEIERYGDVLLDCALLIQLPYWFPPLPITRGGQPMNPQLANNQFFITNRTGSSFFGPQYGYIRYVGFLMFESIQFYQDQILIQEWSGESLMCTQLTEGSYNTSFLEQRNAGLPVGSQNPIAQNATPSQLRISIPLPGLQAPGDGGFPLCCMPSQTFRLKIKLRPLEELIQLSGINGGLDEINPSPFGKPFAYNFFDDIDIPYTFMSYERSQMAAPTILLEMQQAYIPEDTKKALQESQITIPYRRIFENIFTIGEQDYKPLDFGGAATVTRLLDARHHVERVMFIYRLGACLERNIRYHFFNSITDYPQYSDDYTFYNNMKLVIAGQDREYYFPPFVWQDIEALVKDERDNGLGIGEMRWNYGDMFEREKPGPRQPDGGINFSTADRPTLHIQLRNVPIMARLQQRFTELRVFMEAWNVYEIQQGRGRQLFAS